MRRKKVLLENENGLSLTGISHRRFLQLDKDYEQAAAVAELIYASDRQPGITRMKRGSGFVYQFQHKPVRDKQVLDRIRRLVIPPAWTQVWICPRENGHIQATGIDQRGRKQYRYHAQWSLLRHETKFHRLYEFGKALPQLRRAIERDLANKELTENKVIATVIALMEHTSIRIGNESYERLYGSHGLTTLRDKHVLVNGNEVQFSFPGKKGIHHNITLRNKRLARIVQHCRDIPGKELFQYVDASGNRKPVDSGMINRYIKEATGMDCSSRDFRTWAGTLNLLRSLCALGGAGNATECKQHIVQALDEVSSKLGNSRAVCRKYYVHPKLIELYEQNTLSQYVSDMAGQQESNEEGLSQEERLLLNILHFFHN